MTCAIATEQHTRDCQNAALYGDGTPTALTDAGIAAASGGDTPSSHPRNAANIASSDISTFDQTDLLSGSCPTDVTIGSGGSFSFVLPFSQMCGAATMLGNVLIGITALSCLGIVFMRR